MFRTLTLAAATALIAGSAFAADNIFVQLAEQDDDRAAVRALTNTSVGGTTFSTKGVSGVQAIFVQLAEQDDDRAAARALADTSIAGVGFSTKDNSISALEVALKHAIEDDNHMLAAHIAKQLGR